jgi:hypothetical protein
MKIGCKANVVGAVMAQYLIFCCHMLLKARDIGLR